jgi:hypothetical protein
VWLSAEGGIKMNSRINRYDLKQETTKNDLLKCGFREIDGNLSYLENLYSSIELWIRIPNICPIHFDDFDNVVVLDDDYCQPYTPFYEDAPEFEFLTEVINSYNKQMDSFNFLIRREENHE